MSIYFQQRDDGGCALYIDGDLQFDSTDEALYHECLALPALCLARPARPDAVRVLICGGGDGLALRECLRFPGVAQVDLVDYDAEVVEMGRTLLAAQNHFAFHDPRVDVHLCDAWEFVGDGARRQAFDVVLCDFTVPRRPEEARVFTREWYERLKSTLAPGGTIGLNLVSPQATPEAFWCLCRTVQAAGLSALPYRACIPSFRAHGYGAWAFMVATPRVRGDHAGALIPCGSGQQEKAGLPLTHPSSLILHPFPRPLRQADLRALHCPVPTRQADLTRLWRGARFTRRERKLQATVPVYTLDEPCLMRLLLNPGSLARTASDIAGPFDLDPLLRSIPIVHPYHTRDMVEALAEQVVGAVHRLDIRRLLDALLRRAAELPGDLLQELMRLRDFLQDHLTDLERFRQWAYRLFAALVITMTIANTLAPDSVFGKGAEGLGHASVSRGYSGLHEGVGSGHEAAPAGEVSGTGFRSGYGRGYATDMYGYSYRQRGFFYCGSGFGHTHPYYLAGSGRGARHDTAPPQEHKTLFVADDDLLVLDNGDVIVTLSDTAYLLVTNGTVALMDVNSIDPLVPLYPHPGLFQTISQEVRDRKAAVAAEIGSRRDWIGWVGWTEALFPVVKDDWAELRNMEDLTHKLDLAMARTGSPVPPAPLPSPPADGLELFASGYLMPDGTVGMVGPAGDGLFTDGRQLWTDRHGRRANVRPCPAVLEGALKSVLRKLEKEFAADVASDDNDLRSLRSDRNSLDRDLAEYQSLYASYGDPNYEVDYGTDSIPVSDAIARTQRDIGENQRDLDAATAERARLVADYQRIATALPPFGR